jgi:D-glycero-alpha-D-manno-heptose-7-phosphate kinase
LLFYTGIHRSASALLKQQSEEVVSKGEKQRSMARMVALAYELYKELQRNNTGAFGEILHENWMLKKSLVSGVSTNDIDEWYRIGRAAGATGGKILGAGAGGFLMLYAPQDLHQHIKSSLHMLRPVRIGFETLGSRIIFYQ